MRSAQESYQARVFKVLVAANTDAGSRVYRGRPDAFAPEEVPAINARRSVAQHDAFGSGADRGTFEFELDVHVRGDDWETTADALHMQAHAALQGDVTLQALGRGLRCIRTDVRADPGDQTLGRLTATYQVEALLRPTNLTHLVN